MRCTAAPPLIPLLLLTFYSISSLNVAAAGENPFTPKGYLMRYWKKQISNDLPTPEFLFSKASPLSAAQYAAFSKLADQNSLSAQLPEFCTKANLLCFPDLAPSLEKHSDNVNFAAYAGKNFTNYGTDRVGGADGFRSYSENDNVVSDTFRRYSRDSTGHSDKFTAYATESNVVDQSFNTYGTAATGGKGDFSSYSDQVNVPNLGFTSYSDSSNGRLQSFTSYSDDANAGDQKFTSYGKNGNGAGNEFSSYGKDSNVVGSTFNNYGENGNGANDTFTSYGSNTNVPENHFKNYGAQGNAATETFKNYRDQSNVGDDTFDSYGKGSSAAKIDFVNYGQSFNEGTDKFSGYGKDSTGAAADFKIYGVNNTFKDYSKQGTKFARYINESSAVEASLASSGKRVNKWVVEPGKFFRESMLRSGSMMPMPDIRDKMPKRSFLPRVIVSKLPFSTSKLGDLRRIFHAVDDGGSMTKMLTDSHSSLPSETEFGQISDVPLLSCSEATERLRAFRASYESKQQYLAMYSSIYGGITTDPAAMVIPMDDHMVHRGHGVFDTAAIMDGYLYELDQHLDRFIGSAAMAKIKIPFDRESIRRILIQTVSAAKCRKGSLRYWLSAGPGDFQLSPSGCHGSSLYAVVIEDESASGYNGIKVVTSSIPIKPPQFAVMKSVNYLPNALSKMEAEENGAYAAIWLDGDGYIAEGPNMNVAFVTKGKEFVMPKFDKILRGCTARRVLVLAESLVEEGRLRGIQLRDVTVEEGKEADEMMLIGSGVLVRAVVQWDDQVIGDGNEGPVARSLRNLILEDMKSGPATVRVAVPY